MKKLLLTLMLLAAVIAAPRKASADPALPPYCWLYTTTEWFEDTSAWSKWNSSSTGTISFPAYPAPHQDQHQLKMAFNTAGSANDFLVSDRRFDARNYTYAFTGNKTSGCASSPPLPTYAPSFCGFTVDLKTNTPYSSGRVELLDATDYTILTQTTYSFTPVTNPVTTIMLGNNLSSSFDCRRIVLLRIESDKVVGQATSVTYSHPSVSWFY